MSKIITAILQRCKDVKSLTAEFEKLKKGLPAFEGFEGLDGPDYDFRAWYDCDTRAYHFTSGRACDFTSGHDKLICFAYAEKRFITYLSEFLDVKIKKEGL